MRRPTKATPARIKAILRDIADGLTEEQACAINDLHFTTWIDWKKNTDKFPELRANAQARRIKVLLNQKLDWKEPAWDLESNHNFKGQFADPAKIALQLNQHIHGNRDRLTWEQEELEEARRRLDETKRLQLARREEKERDKSREETKARRSPTTIDIEGHVVHEPLALEAPPEYFEGVSERVAQRGGSMRASDMDPLSGERKRRGGDGKEPW
jgi:hypothetical protein